MVRPRGVGQYGSPLQDQVSLEQALVLVHVSYLFHGNGPVYCGVLRLEQVLVEPSPMLVWTAPQQPREQSWVELQLQ